MKHISLLLVFLFTTDVAFSQAKSSFLLSGIIQHENGKALPHATLQLKSVDNPKEAYYEVSDENGHFIFDNVHNEGDYELTVTASGFLDFRKSMHLTKEQSQLTVDTIQLKVGDKKLDEVEVVARKKPAIEVSPDKIVFNVQNSLTSSGLNGLDLLRKSPGVYVDNDNNIIVKGNSGVRIFLDGKPSYMEGEQLKQFLSALRAEEIEKIEIISSPSAKYEAEGTAGIINIVLRKGATHQGFNGSLTANAASVIFTGKYQGSYSALLNYRYKGAALSGAYSFSHGNSYFKLNADRTQDKFYKESLFNDNAYKNHNINLNYDQAINPKHSVNVGMRVSVFQDANNNENTSLVYVKSTDAYTQRVYSPVTESGNTLQLVHSVGYTYKDDTFGELSLMSDYSSYETKNIKDNNNLYYNPLTALDSARAFTQEPHVDVTIIAAKMDWNKTTDRWSLKAGMKYSYYIANNTFTFTTTTTPSSSINLLRSNIFLYDESILAAYIEGSLNLNPFKLSFGLRDEFTSTIGTSKHITSRNVLSEFKRQYNGLFPTVGISFTPNDIHALSLLFSRRLRRPPYEQLNPFQAQEGAFSFFKGNPNLIPEYSNKIELNYTLFQMLSTSLSFTNTENVILTNFDTVGSQTFITSMNLAKRDVWNLSISTPLMLKAAPWLSGFFSLNMMYFTNEGLSNGRLLSLGAFGMNGYAELSVRLPKKFSLQVSGWAIAPSVWEASIEHEAVGSLDVALQKKLWNDKLNIKLYMHDVFATAYFRFSNRRIGQQLENGESRWPAQRVGITISYTWGDTNQAKKRKPTASEEEAERFKGGGQTFGGGAE